MEHIVTNLLDNALKYSEADTVVRAVVFEGDGEVLLTVADEGMGIAADELPQVFDRFSQASNARGHSSVGLGLESELITQRSDTFFSSRRTTANFVESFDQLITIDGTRCPILFLSSLESFFSALRSSSFSRRSYPK